MVGAIVIGFCVIYALIRWWVIRTYRQESEQERKVFEDACVRHNNQGASNG